VNIVSVVDANSSWVDGYFEETNFGSIRVGDPADIKLMGYSKIVRGHVESISRAINVANAQPNGQGVATVNPIFTSPGYGSRSEFPYEFESITCQQASC
jgi:multidrug resistance efflux pump